MSEHIADWCRMPPDPFYPDGRVQFTRDCPACHERLADELRRLHAKVSD